MKNLKKPARLPRKAPSNQTGGTAWGKKLAAVVSRMAQTADMKKLILLNFPYIIAFYMVEKAAWLYRHCNGDSVVVRLMVLFMNFGLAYKSVLPSFHPFDLMVGLVGAAALKAVIYFKGKNAKKYRQGEEYGSARWWALLSAADLWRGGWMMAIRWKLIACVRMERRTPAASCMRRHIVQHEQWATTK